MRLLDQRLHGFRSWLHLHGFAVGGAHEQERQVKTLKRIWNHIFTSWQFAYWMGVTLGFICGVSQ